MLRISNGLRAGGGWHVCELSFRFQGNRATEFPNSVDDPGTLSERSDPDFSLQDVSIKVKQDIACNLLFYR